MKNRLWRNPVTLQFFKRGYEGDPLSPPEGEAACGEHPLDPISPSLPSLKRISRQPPKGHSIFYGCHSGGGGKDCRSPKGRQNNFPMISPKPNNSEMINAAAPKQGALAVDMS
jgi:hypothetical protein